MSDFTPPPTLPPTASPARPRVRWPLVAGALAFLLGLAAMAAGSYYWRRWSPPTGTSAPTAEGLPVVVVPAASAPAPVIDLTALSKRETELAGRLADLERRTAQVGSDAQAASGYAARAEGMLVAFAARRALDRGLRLGYVEDQLRIRFGAAQPHAVAAILQAAREPVTIADLRAGLDGIGTELVTGQASTGWLHSLRNQLANLIIIHRADTPSPLPVDRLARAKQMLEANKVEGALAEVARMPGAPQAVRWTAAARRFIGARQALDTIEAAAITGRTDLPETETPAP